MLNAVETVEQNANHVQKRLWIGGRRNKIPCLQAISIIFAGQMIGLLHRQHKVRIGSHPASTIVGHDRSVNRRAAIGSSRPLSTIVWARGYRTGS
jgi:hypothetical protein